MIGSVQYVSDISTSKQQNVGVDALGNVSCERHGGGIPDSAEWVDDIEDRRCQHLQSFVTWRSFALEDRCATLPCSRSYPRARTDIEGKCGGWHE